MLVRNLQRGALIYKRPPSDRLTITFPPVPVLGANWYLVLLTTVPCSQIVELVGNLVAHGDAREGK